MVKIDDDTQKALLLFNRRSEAAEAAKAAERRLAKAVKAKDEAAAALKEAHGAEAVAAAEVEWRTAFDTWQRLRDGGELPDEAPDEEAADTPDEEVLADEATDEEAADTPDEEVLADE
jgi:multidrug resistance efflux pump